MSDDPKRPESTATLGEDAAQLARGSAVVMAGGIGERVLRMVTTWFLSGALGVVGFGIYTLMSTVVGIVVAFAPLGADAGIVMFGARYRSAGEQGRLKGVLLSTLLLAAVGGPLFTVGLWAVLRSGLVLSDRPIAADAVLSAAAAIAIGAMLTMVVGALVSAKDMVGQAIANQLVLPGATLLGVGIAMAIGAGLEGVILAFVIAHGIALLVGTARMLKRDLPLLRNKLITAEFELGTLLRYALPQSLARALYRANLWVDILMLTWLATLADVGVYRVSVALAMLGALPVMASTTMFGPVVAELVYARDMDRLNALLKIVTRWLIVISAPLYIGVLLLPDLILALFDPAYLAGTTALGVLMAGQAIYVACAPTGACLTNAGYAMLNLINGLVAVAINVALNLLWIPEYGIMGAAGASASALSLWSLLRVIEVHVLLKCSPVSARSVVAIVGAVGMGFGLSGLLAGQGPLVRVLSVAAALLVGLGLMWRFGRTAEDDIVIGMVAAKLGR